MATIIVVLPAILAALTLLWVICRHLHALKCPVPRTSGWYGGRHYRMRTKRASWQPPEFSPRGILTRSEQPLHYRFSRSGCDTHRTATNWIRPFAVGPTDAIPLTGERGILFKNCRTSSFKASQHEDLLFPEATTVVSPSPCWNRRPLYLVHSGNLKRNNYETLPVPPPLKRLRLHYARPAEEQPPKATEERSPTDALDSKCVSSFVLSTPPCCLESPEVSGTVMLPPPPIVPARHTVENVEDCVEQEMIEPSTKTAIRHVHDATPALLTPPKTPRTSLSTAEPTSVKVPPKRAEEWRPIPLRRLPLLKTNCSSQSSASPRSPSKSCSSRRTLAADAKKPYTLMCRPMRRMSSRKIIQNEEAKEIERIITITHFPLMRLYNIDPPKLRVPSEEVPLLETRTLPSRASSIPATPSPHSDLDGLSSAVTEGETSCDALEVPASESKLSPYKASKAHVDSSPERLVPSPHAVMSSPPVDTTPSTHSGTPPGTPFGLVAAWAPLSPGSPLGAQSSPGSPHQPPSPASVSPPPSPALPPPPPAIVIAPPAPAALLLPLVQPPPIVLPNGQLVMTAARSALLAEIEQEEKDATEFLDRLWRQNDLLGNHVLDLVRSIRRERSRLRTQMNDIQHGNLARIQRNFDSHLAWLKACPNAPFSHSRSLNETEKCVTIQRFLCNSTRIPLHPFPFHGEGSSVILNHFSLSSNIKAVAEVKEIRRHRGKRNSRWESCFYRRFRNENDASNLLDALIPENNANDRCERGRCSMLSSGHRISARDFLSEFPSDGLLPLFSSLFFSNVGGSEDLSVICHFMAFKLFIRVSLAFKPSSKFEY